jgi:dihydrofolate synthase / folylpolyglutamate synthase
MKFASLEEWLQWLEKSHPTEIDLGLDRVREVAERLKLIDTAEGQYAPRVITVAGTNGKGSCVTACAALLMAAGYSVGVYTSPHLLHYAERIQVNSVPVADQEICAAFEKISEARSAISLTYFEYGTLAALDIFKQYAVDFMVLEVGLGGRLDAVNIIDANISVITSIALDHQQWLGDTRELIGREKAGILRANSVLVCADENPPLSILEYANQLQTKNYFIGREFFYAQSAETWRWQGQDQWGKPVFFSGTVNPHLPWPSVAAALQVICALDIFLAPNIIQKTLAGLQLAGRFQKIHYREREFIVDVAHNPAATHYFSKRLQEQPSPNKTHALVAMMADKDRIGSLANLLSIISDWYLLDLTDLPRAATAKELANDLLTLNIKERGCGEINAIMDQLFSATDKGDRIAVFGSFHTVAAVLLYMQNNS